MNFFSTFYLDEDEDGDRITVRGDPEMVAMMDFVSLSPSLTST